MRTVERLLLAAAAAAALGGTALPAAAAATIILNNVNAPGVGLNDPTPALPVGGNTGTTLGAQRLEALRHAFNLWGATLDSSVPITVNVSFEPLACNSSGAVLGSAGTLSIYSDFVGAPRSGTWYPSALANKLAGVDLDGTAPDIRARFNVNLGDAGCLTGTPFYYGLDGNEGGGVDLVAVALHELGHGLGFQTFTSGSTGASISGVPSIWDHYLLDTTTNLTWAQSTATQRVQSAISVDKLVWSGPQVAAAAPSVLAKVPAAIISGPAAGPLTGWELQAGQAQFGPALTVAGVVGELMPVVVPNTTGPACVPLAPLDVLAVAGKVALIDRGGCAFLTKVKNAQNAGAIGVVIANIFPGLLNMTGTDPTITIPSVLVSQADGNALKTQLAKRSRTKSGVFARIGLSSLRGAGTDRLGRPLMYAPATFASGSSVAHWDITASPNLLMEPSINPDLTQSLQPPQDLTMPLLRDLGW